MIETSFKREVKFGNGTKCTVDFTCLFQQDEIWSIDFPSDGLSNDQMEELQQRINVGEFDKFATASLELELETA